jgi:hypothetical protein
MIEISAFKNTKTLTHVKSKTKVLHLAMDCPIQSNALLENEIVMTFENIKSKGDAIIYCFQHMDVGMLNDLLADDLTYEDKSKPHFIKILTQKFQVFSDAGDTYLKCFKGRCNGKSCHNKNTLVGFDFVGNKTKNRITFIVDIDQGNIINLFECIAYKRTEINLKEFFKNK